MNNLGKHLSSLALNASVYSVIAGLVVSGVSFVIMVHLSRVAGVDQVGLVTFVMSIAAFLKLFDFFGASHSARYLAKFKNPHAHKHRVLMAGLVANNFVYGVFGLLLLAGLEYALQNPLNNGFNSLFELQSSALNLKIAVLVILFNSIQACNSGILDGTGDTNVRLLITIIISLACLLFYFLLIEKPSSTSVLVFFAGHSFSVSFFQGAYIFWSTKAKRHSLLSVLNTVKEMRNYGLKVHFSTLSTVSFDPIFKTVLATFVGIETLGVYELATKSIAFIKSGFLNALQPIVPMYVREYCRPKNRTDNLDKSLLVTLIAATIAIGLLIIFSPLLSIVFIGTVHFQFILLSVGSGLSSWINILSSPLYLYMQTNGHVVWNNLTQVMTAALAFLFLLSAGATFLAPEFSLFIAVSCASVLNFILNYWLAKKLGLEMFSSLESSALLFLMIPVVLTFSLFAAYVQL
jgi:O-antigen/teichoic acid export membrane protein